MQCNRNTPRRQAGFTLVEVLVALAIVGVALAASVRAVGMLAQNNAALRAKSLALVEAENQMAELRLARMLPSPGRQSVPCAQGGQAMQCERVFTNSDNANIRQVMIRVRPEGEPDRVLAQVNGFLSTLP